MAPSIELRTSRFYRCPTVLVTKVKAQACSRRLLESTSRPLWSGISAHLGNSSRKRDDCRRIIKLNGTMSVRSRQPDVCSHSYSTSAVPAGETRRRRQAEMYPLARRCRRSHAFENCRSVSQISRSLGCRPGHYTGTDALCTAIGAPSNVLHQL